jgi:hypothetical protein
MKLFCKIHFQFGNINTEYIIVMLYASLPTVVIFNPTGPSLGQQ